MQAQAGLQVHAGALTALAMQGRAHYLRLGRETVFLFSPPQTGLPAWFKGHDWGAEVRHFKTSFLPPDTAMKEYQAGPFPIKISAPERAIMECLHLSPLTVDLVECFQIMEGLAALRPKLLQELLESCGSVKVTRLFLYMADKAAHAWLERLDTSKFDLGSGTRAVTESGVYISKYDMTVPEELAKL